jgi:hypothetical protein
MAGKKQKLKYQAVLEEFLAAREWKDEIEIDAETKSVKLAAGISIAGQDGRLFIEASDVTEYVDAFIYFEFRCRENKLDQMAILLNEIHRRWLFGRFICFPDGVVRWTHRVDFENSSPTGLSIERIIKPGWDAAERFLEPISAVALTKQSAKDAIAEFDEEQSKKEEKAEGDGPEEL